MIRARGRRAYFDFADVCTNGSQLFFFFSLFPRNVNDGWESRVAVLPTGGGCEWQSSSAAASLARGERDE